ncbi:hypothetical protein HNQ38_000245 [Desulfovibrio intestinalis]|uniref:Uncharacterized protein n=1 Tax=Desulfovibrio intestinalis TaxID=58621 RepID=A0A7W8C0F9_9BACT|nr:hypothetical protein [Desulfovibrio intestinalis]
MKVGYNNLNELADFFSANHCMTYCVQIGSNNLCFFWGFSYNFGNIFQAHNNRASQKLSSDASEEPEHSFYRITNFSMAYFSEGGSTADTRGSWGSLDFFKKKHR